MIRVEGMNKAYGNQVVLNNVWKQFDAGKIHGIVGNNGSGKSTFFRCLIGLEHYDGTIGSPWPDLKSRIGYLPSEPFMFKKITGREYLRFVCVSRKLSPIDLNKRNIFDLPLDAYAAEYSTGMRKKLALMAILLQKNQLLYILDEPFNGIDMESNILITEIIRHLSALGKTVMLSSHIFSTLSNTCDQIHQLKDRSFSKAYERNEFEGVGAAMENKMLSHKIALLGLAD